MLLLSESQLRKQNKKRDNFCYLLPIGHEHRKNVEIMLIKSIICLAEYQK